jgi:hypothetical protein
MDKSLLGTKKNKGKLFKRIWEHRLPPGRPSLA